MDITPLLSYLRSTSNLALSCKGFAWRVSSNGFPIQTSESDLCLENFSFYKLLEFPNLEEWTISEFDDAIRTDGYDRLLLLLRGGANIEAHIYGQPVLIFATRIGKFESLKLLLQHKANIEAKDYRGDTALICAAYHGYAVECLKLLLQHKANIEAKDCHGDTALINAARFGETDCLKVLLQSGAQVDPRLRESYPQYAELWGDSTL